MVRELAADAVDLHEPWRAAGGDPAYWRPSGDEIRAVQSCDLVVLNGAGFEKWAEQAALPRARTIDTTAAARAQLIEEAGETHSHGPEGEHAHGGTAFTTWLSPAIARVQMTAVAEGLSRIAPARADAIGARAKELHESFNALGERLKQVGAARPRWLASHPVYQYLARDGGMTIDSMHWEPGEMPSDTEWTKFRLTRAGQPRPTAWMLWEGEPGAEIRAKLAEEGVEVVVFSPHGEAAGETAGDAGSAGFLGSIARGIEAMAR